MDLYHLLDVPHIRKRINLYGLQPVIDRLGFEVLGLTDAGYAKLVHTRESFNSYQVVSSSGAIWKIRWWRRRDRRCLYVSCGNDEFVIATPDDASHVACLIAQSA